MRHTFRPSRHSARAYGVSGDNPYTGYYKDGGGYAWYYNDEDGYFDLIAAPSTSKTKKRTRFTSGDVFDSAMKNAKGRTFSTKDEVLATAKAVGGAELPDPDGLAKGVAVETTISASDEEIVAPGKKRQVRRGRRPTAAPGGLSTAQMVGIGAAGVVLLIGAAFAVRAAK